MKKQIFIYISILLFLALGTIVVILYGEGYQFDFTKGRPELTGTGLLVLTSTPDGAQVFINNHLTTATNNTINLAPGTYNVRIAKDGYFDWDKQVIIDKEVVSKAEALLFPRAPKLENITDTGVTDPVMDPSQTKLAFTISSQSAQQNGIYILDMGARSLLTLQSGASQIASDTTIPFSTASISWSPDGKNLLASVSGQFATSTYLLSTSGFNATPQDVSSTLSDVQDSWNTLIAEKNTARLLGVTQVLRKFLTDNTTILAWSPDETKILYTATTSATLPLIINPPLIGADSTPQLRTIQAGSIYVYDSKEDKNFKLDLPASQVSIGNSQSPQALSWFPDSKHLIVVHDKKIDIREYDGSNNTTIYAGPFIDDFVFPWPTADKIVMLTSFNNPNTAPNLYTIDLR